MILRRLTDSDSREHNKVASQAYAFSSDIDSVCRLSDQCVIGAFDGENLMAQLNVQDVENYFGDSILSCAGIGGVASKPEYRNRGAVRKLFEAVFDGELTGKEFDISILYPFSEAYYRKFGYEIMSKNLELTVPFNEILAQKNADAELYDGTQKAEILELYNKAAKGFNLAFRRQSDGDFCPNPYSSARYTYMWKKNGEYRSMATFSVDRPNKTIYVYEIYYLDRESLEGILGFLRVYEGNQDTIVFRKLPIDTPVLNLVANERNIHQLGLNMGCARIINLESVLLKKKYPDEHGVFTIRCEGDSVEKNNNTFTVEYEKGCAEVARTDAEPDIILQPCSAAKIILCGVSGFNALSYMNGVEIKNANRDFTNAFPVEHTFFCDSF